MSAAKMMICNHGSPCIRTTFGSVQFEKDIPRLVAPLLIPHALAVGVVLAEGEKLTAPEVTDKGPDPIDVGTRTEIIKAAIDTMRNRTERTDWTAGATPVISVVRKLTGLKKVGAHEVQAILAEEDELRESIRMAAEKAKQEEKAKKADKPAAPKMNPEGHTDGAEDC